MLNLDGHAARGHLVLRNYALYHHTVNAVGLRLHNDGAYLAHADAAQQGLVADAGCPNRHAAGIAGNDKVAVLIAHAAVQECGISVAEQRDVGELYGVSGIIDQPANDFRGFLLRTLHEDVVLVVAHFHGVEADDLVDGFFQRQVGEVAGHGEVLQLVVDEVDGLVASGGIEVFQHLRE